MKFHSGGKHKHTTGYYFILLSIVLKLVCEKMQSRITRNSEDPFEKELFKEEEEKLAEVSFWATTRIKQFKKKGKTIL